MFFRKAPKTISERLILAFRLIEDGEFIRFPDAPEELLARYMPEIEMVHTASFRHNPLRYIEKMIENCQVSESEKEKRKLRLSKVVQRAFKDDPLMTVRSIVNSMARVAKF